jgi:hypothetical protein
MEHFISWEVSFFCLLIFLLSTFGVWLVTRKNSKYLDRVWILTTAWFCVSLYIILTDGEFAKTLVAVTVVIVAGVCGLMFMFTHNRSIGDVKFKLGDKSIEIEKKR